MERKRDGGMNGEYNGIIRLRVIRMVGAVRIMGARIRGRRKYRSYRGMRVGLVRISYEVVLILILLRVGRRWRGGRGIQRE